MIRTATALIALSLLLAGCGANGAPEPPEGYQPHPDRDFVLDPLVKAPDEGQSTASDKR